MSLAPLELPSPDHDDLDEVARSAAVALFTQRARADKADLAPHTGQRRRGRRHLPAPGRTALALELAAARINLLSSSALLARLDHRLKLLTSGRRDAAQRKRTLKEAIAWSYGLLSPDEQIRPRALRGLAAIAQRQGDVTQRQTTSTHQLLCVAVLLNLTIHACAVPARLAWRRATSRPWEAVNVGTRPRSD